MIREVYKNYSDDIRSILIEGSRRGNLTKGFSNEHFDKNTALTAELKDRSLFNSLTDLTTISGKQPKYNERPGSHPDFIYLKDTNGIEYHYITSMFLDIKNSTGLFRKFDPLSVAKITTAVQKVALHTCWYFNGYIQRFHGDGLLVYFGDKRSTLQQSVQNALNASSFFTYFMQHDLENIFSALEIEDRLYTRIGIDTGYNEDVVWHVAGLKDCSEITTCSLHTSLAAKMQVKACSNGIMVGDKVKVNSTLHTDIFSIIKDKEGKEDRYIYRNPNENFYYTQWAFDWANFVKNHKEVVVGEDGKLYFRPKDFPSTQDSNNKINNEFLKKNVQGYKPHFSI